MKLLFRIDPLFKSIAKSKLLNKFRDNIFIFYIYSWTFCILLNYLPTKSYDKPYIYFTKIFRMLQFTVVIAILKSFFSSS